MPDLPREFVLPVDFLPPMPDKVATPRDAATVILLRDTADGVEVFLQHRVRGMAFAAGMTVFPGGGVDSRDSAPVAWAGPPPSWWGERFGCETGLAQALVCTAVRETFEESGVLLAGPDEHSVVRDAASYRGERAALVAGELSMARFLADAGLVLRADLLRPWAHWLTPPEEPRRYDTRFLLAALPPGQQADGVTSEAEAAGWQNPRDTLADWRAGQRFLLPPTWFTLSELVEHATVAELLTASDSRTIERVMPRVARHNAGLYVVMPGDPGYEDAANHLNP